MVGCIECKVRRSVQLVCAGGAACVGSMCKSSDKFVQGFCWQSTDARFSHCSNPPSPITHFRPHIGHRRCTGSTSSGSTNKTQPWRIGEELFLGGSGPSSGAVDSQAPIEWHAWVHFPANLFKGRMRGACASSKLEHVTLRSRSAAIPIPPALARRIVPASKADRKAHRPTNRQKSAPLRPIVFGAEMVALCSIQFKHHTPAVLDA